MPWYSSLWGLCQALVECGTKAPKGGQWSRRNGWSLPLNPLQLLAWFFLIFFLLFYFAVLVPSCPPGAWQICLYVLNTVIAIVHIISHICSTSIDPVDHSVLTKNSKGPLPVFDRSKHAHVIENQFCYICEVKVGSKSKHCSSCNKCIATFDHHCKWLNNCVGRKNYRYFAVCIASALAASLLIFCVSVALIVAYLVKDSWLHVSSLDSNNSTVAYSESAPLKDPMFVVFVAVDATLWLFTVVVCALLSFFAICLLSHLSGFHLFLAFRGLSTYDYIVQKRDASFHSAASGKTNDLFLRWCKMKANQVSPAQQLNQGMRSGKENAVERNNTNAKRDIKDDAQKDEKSASLCAGDVYVGSPTHQHFILRGIQRSHPKASQTGKGTKPTQVLDCGNRTPTVQIAQPGSEFNYSRSERVGL